jgi:hypothetical protein
MSGAIDLIGSSNPFSLIGKAFAGNAIGKAIGIKTGRAEDDPEHWKRQRDAEMQRTTQALAEQKQRYEVELAKPENVKKRAMASAASLGESGRRPSASQYLSGM